MDRGGRNPGGRREKRKCYRRGKPVQKQGTVLKTYSIQQRITFYFMFFIYCTLYNNKSHCTLCFCFSCIEQDQDGLVSF